MLYDLTSTSMEGRHCPLARRGYSRDGRPGMLQVEYGLVTDAEGRPVAVEVVPGDTADPATVPAVVEKLKDRFDLDDVVLVGDRGMLTSARIEALRDEGLGWISSLRAPAIRKLAQAGTLQLGLFDERGLAEISDPAYPGERLVVCRNPLLADERARKRAELLAATSAKLAPIVARVETGRLRGADRIGLAVGRVIDRYKVAKHFALDIGDDRLMVTRREEAIMEEAALDGLYVLRTSVPAERLDDVGVVRAYKRLSRVERAFRGLKAVDLQVRPIHHHTEPRVRAHIFLCLLAYYVRWHLERAWAPLLFRDEERPELEHPVAPAVRSEAALAKAHTQRLPDGTPVHRRSRGPGPARAAPRPGHGADREDDDQRHGADDQCAAVKDAIVTGRVGVDRELEVPVPGRQQALIEMGEVRGQGQAGDVRIPEQQPDERRHQHAEHEATGVAGAQRQPRGESQDSQGQQGQHVRTQAQRGGGGGVEHEQRGDERAQRSQGHDDQGQQPHSLAAAPGLRAPRGP